MSFSSYPFRPIHSLHLPHVLCTLPGPHLPRPEHWGRVPLPPCWCPSPGLGLPWVLSPVERAVLPRWGGEGWGSLGLASGRMPCSLALVGQTEAACPALPPPPPAAPPAMRRRRRCVNIGTCRHQALSTSPRCSTRPCKVGPSWPLRARWARCGVGVQPLAPARRPGSEWQWLLSGAVVLWPVEVLQELCMEAVGFLG